MKGTLPSGEGLAGLAGEATRSCSSQPGAGLLTGLCSSRWGPHVRTFVNAVFLESLKSASNAFSFYSRVSYQSWLPAEWHHCVPPWGLSHSDPDPMPQPHWSRFRFCSGWGPPSTPPPRPFAGPAPSSGRSCPSPSGCFSSRGLRLGVFSPGRLSLTPCPASKPPCPAWPYGRRPRQRRFHALCCCLLPELISRCREPCRPLTSAHPV